MAIIVQSVCFFLLLGYSSSIHSSTPLQPIVDNQYQLGEQFLTKNGEMIDSMRRVLTELSYNMVDQMESRFRSKMANRFNRGFSSDSSEDLDDYINFSKSRSQFLREIGKLNQSLPILFDEMSQLKIFATRTDQSDLHYQTYLPIFLSVITALITWDAIKYMWNSFRQSSNGYNIARESFRNAEAKLFSPHSEYGKMLNLRLLLTN